MSERTKGPEERWEEEVAYYRRHGEKMEEIAHIWERVGREMIDVAEERRKIAQELKLAMGFWIGLAAAEGILLVIAAISLL